MNSGQSKRPLIRVPYILILLVGAVTMVIAFLPPSLFWPHEKRAEQKKLYALAEARIESVGGWPAIQQACLDLATNAENGVFISRGTDRPMSSVLAKLKPREIYMSPNPDGIPVMRIQLFGMHRTGYFDAPYFGIWVVCTNISTNYIPPVDMRKRGMVGIIVRKGGSIFEVR